MTTQPPTAPESSGSAAYDRHVASQPEAVAALLSTPVPVLDPARPLVFTGIGTSLHACRIAAAWVRLLTGGRVRAAALDAHDLALTEGVTAADQIVVVSHRGTKACPNDVLRRAAEAGATTVAITGEGPAEPVADTVLRTCPQEAASTHTVSYTTALTLLARLVATAFGEAGAPLTAALAQVPEALSRTLRLPVAPEAVDALADAAGPVLVTGTGLDAITAAEAALKIKEGTYRWAEALHTEFALHGTPAVFSATTAGFLLRPAGPDAGRTADLERVLRALGAPVHHCADDPGAALPFAAVPDLVRPLVSVVPFQRLVSLAAVRTGASPDLTHLEAEPWASAIRSVKL
ncbi:SIS domain-containing protein [Streptomyces sp. NPDC014892]|uniref:SIS domain-containing protein n=1 Tax=Streptomyces sp. NPDC014892 TaxID=3364930 RepID=UPI0036FD82D0